MICRSASDAQIIVSRFPCGAQPFYTTLGTKGRRPDGCHMSLCAASAGPFGNTAFHRFFTKAHGFPAAAGGIDIYMMAPKAPTSPAGTVSQPIGKPFNGQAKGLLWLTWRSYAGPPQYFIPPEGEKPGARPGGVSQSRTEPWQPRAERPGGWLNLHARKGRRAFGNTGKHRPLNPLTPQAP